jgi:acetolactate synthase I/II/III large subunit
LARTAADAVVDVLADRGVRRFYTVPGESFLELIDAVSRRPGLRLVSCRHESGAAFMAEAEGKLTGIPAVAMATRAVGASNMAIGLHTARQDSTPLLALLGQVETERLGREAFQEVDLPRLLAEVTVHAETLHRPERASEVAARAYRLATTGRPGPVAVAFPADVLGGECTAPVPPQSRTAAVRPEPAARDAIATLLRDARAPVAILGAGAKTAREQVHALVRRYGLGVYTAFRRQDTFPNSDPHYLGHLTLGTPAELLRPLQQADVVLVLGCRLSEITTQDYTLPAPGARVVQVDVDPSVLGATVPVEWAVPAPVAGFAAALLEIAEPVVRRDWRAGHTAYLASTVPPGVPGGRPVADGAAASPGVHPAAVVAAMRRRLPATTVLTNDAGNFSIFCHRYWRFDHPDTQVAPTSGAMGYGVPAAVAASLLAPDRPVVALCGDGGFLMTGQELETAVRCGAPILVVVFANRLYGTIAMHQARQLGRPAGVDIGAVDIAGYARALGADALTVRFPAELDDAFAAAARFDRPRVIEVRTDPDVLSPAASLSGLLGTH